MLAMFYQEKQKYLQLIRQYNMMFLTLAKRFSTVKPLKVLAVSTPKGIHVTYPHQENKSHDIQNPLETLIAALAACQTSILRIVAGKSSIKLGNITFSRIQSGFDLSHMIAGGKQSKINDIFIDVEVEAKTSEAQFAKIRQQVENICPVYQMIQGSGVKINSNWKLKELV